MSIPGRGRFTSALLALSVIALMVIAGVLVIFTYLEAVEDAPREAAEAGYVNEPMVDMGK